MGFRPYVYRAARQFGLTGQVNNSLDGVHVLVNGSRDDVNRFYRQLIRDAPVLARITYHRINESEPHIFEDFRILPSPQGGCPNLLIAPDFAICDACRAELYQDQNRRNGYAFNTCTHCGPRYSLIRQLPYDREHTTMDPFHMCPACRKEYHDPLDRRYYAQTNSCPDCGIHLSLYGAQTAPLPITQEEIPEEVVRLWKAGEIVAIKGIGGYLLTCDAANAGTLKELRKRKHRPSKPFALMYPGLESLERDLKISALERAALTDAAAPIVLLEPVEDGVPAWTQEDIAPNLDRIGAMLPYTPLYELLLRKFGRPIVATSGNISNSPIVFRDDVALRELKQIAGYVLVNNREIVIPQDDSVLVFTPVKERRIVLRRSRGLAPNYVGTSAPLSAVTSAPLSAVTSAPLSHLAERSLMATGAMLKSTFTILHNGNTFVSQYLGDLENFDTQENYKHTIRHFFQLFDGLPELILTDKHPEYASTEYGLQLAAELGIPIEPIQHHIAHFAAVLGENDLTHVSVPVLGVIWDGTGLGDDGQIWGGEFFKFENLDFLRCAHFDYFDFMLGDKMPREPRISALSACRGIPGAEGVLNKKFNAVEWALYQKIPATAPSLKTSSVGRIFDAVASLLGLMDVQTFEGEAAMQLERLAAGYFRANGLDFESGYLQENAPLYPVPTRLLMSGILRDLQTGKTNDFIAARFHFSLVDLIRRVARSEAVQKIAFSGGVFQNVLLVDLIQHHLEEEFDLFFHRELSPNDENVSFGQLVYHQVQQRKKSIFKDKTKDYVLSDSR